MPGEISRREISGPTKVKDVPGCRGCPLYQTGGQGFVPDIVRESSRVMVLGQNPGAQEEQEGTPFVGQTGQEMERTYLPLAGLTRSDISIGNALRCRWNNSNKLPDIQSKLARAAVEHCTRAHLRMPGGTRLVVAQGGYALLATSGHGYLPYDKITNWRGWMLPLMIKDTRGELVNEVDPAQVYTPRVGEGFPPVLSTVHVAAIGYDASLKLPAQVDWQKVDKFLRGEWPESPPPILREIDDDLFDFEAAWDTEYIPETNTLLRFSVATGEGKVYVVEAFPELRATLTAHMGDLQPLPGSLARGLSLRLAPGGWEYASPEDRATIRIFFQNAGADLPYLARILPLGTVIAIEDEMLAHSVLHGGLPHDLDYLASLHATINRHKHLAQSNPVVYSGMDALVQYQVWRALERQLRADPQSERIYREHVLPLVPIILEAEEAGVLIDQHEVARGVGYLQHEIDDAVKIANAASGYKLNLGSSQQVGRQLYDVEKHKAPRGRR